MSDQSLFSDDEPLFGDDENQSQTAASQTWKILIADDEPDVHKVTRMVLHNFSFDGLKLELISAYSGQEAKDIMAQRDDIALAILDVVMEDEHAGLEVARYIREDLHNRYTRLVLRTGQPGQAPENEVIRNYDINDYKDKTELTTTKLNTLLYATLRSYRDICTLNQHRKGLEGVIEASTEVFSSGTLNKFASAVLSQITNLLGLEQSALYCSSITHDTQLDIETRTFRILAATGDMETTHTVTSLEELPLQVQEGFKEVLSDHKSHYHKDYYIGYFSTQKGSESLLYVTYHHELSELDKQLLEIYAANVAVTYENLLMRDDIQETQKELVYMLGEAVEQRSKETGAHVKRVAQISQLLAGAYGLPEQETELIKLASPLHDVGKVGIPDSILNKPGKHTPEEWEVMKTHAMIGEEILAKSDKRILQLGSIIAGQHHEKWDGNGYPRGLKGEDIHIAGRITALADVFDALGSKRCYKEAWPIEKIIAIIKEERGKQFEPKLVDLFEENIDALVEIRKKFPDSY
jgi:response regulator RpfG family c-di-GMP phosphodiesterase